MTLPLFTYIALFLPSSSGSDFPSLGRHDSAEENQHISPLELISPHSPVHVARICWFVCVHIFKVFPSVLFIDTYFYQIITAA